MKNLMALMMAIAAVFTACSTEDPAIICGRDWNPASEVVVDTSSEFLLSDPMIVQFRYGKSFDFNKLKVAFFEGTLTQKGPEIWNHEIGVTSKMAVYTLQGKSKHGGLMTAREMMHHKKIESAVIEVSGDGRVIASKEINLIKNR